MSDGTSRIQNENLATIVAVTFVLALLGLAFSFFTYSRVGMVAGIAANSDEAVHAANAGQVQDLTKRLGELEAKVAKLEAAAAAPAPAPAP